MNSVLDEIGNSGVLARNAMGCTPCDWRSTFASKFLNECYGLISTPENPRVDSRFEEADNESPLEKDL